MANKFEESTIKKPDTITEKDFKKQADELAGDIFKEEKSGKAKIVEPTKEEIDAINNNLGKEAIKETAEIADKARENNETGNGSKKPLSLSEKNQEKINKAWVEEGEEKKEQKDKAIRIETKEIQISGYKEDLEKLKKERDELVNEDGVENKGQKLRDLNSDIIEIKDKLKIFKTEELEKKEEPEDEIIDLIDVVKEQGKNKEFEHYAQERKSEILEELEKMPEKEKKGIFRAAVDISYALQEWKSSILSNLLKKAVGEKRIKGKGSSIHESGLGKRFLNAYSENYKERAELAKENRERERVSALRGGGSLLRTAGSFIKLGRVIWDVGYANPLRHVMAASMFTAKNAEMLKEARLKRDKIIEKTRIKDAEEAALEAWNVHEEAEITKGKGGKILKEDLEKEYQKILVGDLGKRLEKRNKKDGFILSKIVQDFGGFLINSKIKRIDKKISKIKEKKGIFPHERREMIERYLERQKKNLNDYDRMVSTAGTIDLLSYTGRIIEKTGKAVSVAMIADTLYRLPKIFASFTESSIEPEMPPKTTSEIEPEAFKEVVLDKKLSNILESKIAEKGDSSLLLAKKIYIKHAEELGYKESMGDINKWAGKFSTRHIVGQYIGEHSEDYKELIDKIGTPPENPIELDKWMSKVPGSTFNEVLNNKVPNLIHVGDTVSIDVNGNINAYSPEGKLRIGNLPIETQGIISTEGFGKIMEVEEFSNLSTEQVERINKLFSRHLGASFEGFQSFDAAERAEKIANLEETINKLKKEPSSNFIKKQLQELNMVKEIWAKFGLEDVEIPKEELASKIPEVSQESIIDETGTEIKGETPVGSEDNIKEINELFKKQGMEKVIEQVKAGKFSREDFKELLFDDARKNDGFVSDKERENINLIMKMLDSRK